MNSLPVLNIGNVPIFGKMLLAPMDGYTDQPFRLVCRRQGSAVSVSEFINGIDIENGHPHLETKLVYSEEERPFAYQIFDDNPERLLRAALKLRERNPDYIDVNMGCSARNVSNRGAGAGLLKEPAKIAQIISGLTKNLDIPVTAKIRLGWDDNTKNFLEVGKILQDNGASAVTLHARTRKQEYSGSADWAAISALKNSLTIPVIGNGDIKSPVDARRMIDETGCDAVMIGRAAIGNPWVFWDDRFIPDTNARFAMVKEHLSLMTRHYGPKIGVLLFRKHLSRYLAAYLLTSEIRREIFAITHQEQLVDYISKLLLPEEYENAELGK